MLDYKVTFLPAAAIGGVTTVVRFHVEAAVVLLLMLLLSMKSKDHMPLR